MHKFLHIAISNCIFISISHSFCKQQSLKLKEEVHSIAYLGLFCADYAKQLIPLRNKIKSPGRVHFNVYYLQLSYEDGCDHRLRWRLGQGVRRTTIINRQV